MNSSKFSLLIIPLALSFLGASCTLPIGIGGGGGGIYKSPDRGGSWEQISSIGLDGGGRRSFSGDDITTIAIDPRDARTVIAGTRGKGLLASESAGVSWRRVYDENVTVIGIATDPRSKCVLYFATEQQLLKTSDCAKTWKVMFDETRGAVKISDIEIDRKDPKVIYITNTAGELIKSETYGITWSVSYIFPNGNAVRSMAIDGGDHQTLYVSTRDIGIFRSLDRGDSWEDISGGFNQIPGGMRGKTIGTLSRGGALWYVSDGGVFFSESGGLSWHEISLLASAQQADVLAFTVNPVNDQELYYATENTIYYSNDRGLTWVPHPLPSKKSASVITVDPFNPATIYLGTQEYTPGFQLFKL